MNNNSSNSINSNSGSGSRNNKILSLENKSLKVLYIALGVILIIFSIIMIYIAVTYPKKRHTPDMTTEVLLNYIHDCKNNPLEISAKNLPPSTAGNEYSLTFWVFITSLDSDYLQDKSYNNFDIITKGPVVALGDIKAIDTDMEQPIKVYLKNKSNTLQVDMQKEEGSTYLLEGRKGCYSYDSTQALPPLPSGGNITRKFFPDNLTTITEPTGKTIQEDDEYCNIESRRIENQYFGMVRTSASDSIADDTKVKGDKKECKYLTSLDIMNLNDDVMNGIIQKDISSNPDNCYSTDSLTKADKKTTVDLFNSLIPAIENAVKHIDDTVTAAAAAAADPAAAAAAKEAADADVVTADANVATAAAAVTAAGTDPDALAEATAAKEAADAAKTAADAAAAAAAAAVAAAGSANPKINAFNQEYTTSTNNNIIKVKEELGETAPANEDVLALYTAAKKFFVSPHPPSANYTALKNEIDIAIETAKGKLNTLTAPDTYIYVDAIDEKESLKPCRVVQFPIQRWNCITLNVHNNIVDLFMDGKLLHTCLYDGNLKLNNDPIIIGNRGGFDGYVSNVTWSNKSLGATEIYKIYSQGPRIRLTANDRIKYMFMRKPKDLEAGLKQQESVNQESTGRL